MSHLPEKGEAIAAAEVLNRRLHSVGDDEDRFVAEVNVRTGDVRGDESPMRATYGDLFDIAELAGVAVVPVHSFIEDIAAGVDPQAAMLSLYLLAAAHGCLMERARWSR